LIPILKCVDGQQKGFLPAAWLVKKPWNMPPHPDWSKASDPDWTVEHFLDHWEHSSIAILQETEFKAAANQMLKAARVQFQRNLEMGDPHTLPEESLTALQKFQAAQKKKKHAGNSGKQKALNDMVAAKAQDPQRLEVQLEQQNRAPLTAVQKFQEDQKKKKQDLAAKSGKQI